MRYFNNNLEIDTAANTIDQQSLLRCGVLPMVRLSFLSMGITGWYCKFTGYDSGFFTITAVEVTSLIAIRFSFVGILPNGTESTKSSRWLRFRLVWPSRIFLRSLSRWMGLSICQLQRSKLVFLSVAVNLLFLFYSLGTINMFFMIPRLLYFINITGASIWKGICLHMV